MHLLEQLKENMHLLLGGAFSFWVYKEQINKMSFSERVFYVALSVLFGFYGGNAAIDICGLNPASGRAHLIAIILTIFGLATLGLFRDNLAAIFESVRKKWLG